MKTQTDYIEKTQGILLVDKPRGKTSFDLVRILRKKLGIRKIGHAGTLDPLATGVMVMLIGRRYTSLSERFLNDDKEYVAKICLGIETDSYDSDGTIIERSSHSPTYEEVDLAIKHFQGEILQTPPMFSAKKQNGIKLYQLARQGLTIDRKPKLIKVNTRLLNYTYPFVTIHVECSKGTYVRSIAHDLGKMVKSGAHLIELQRTRSGAFHLKDCLNGEMLFSQDFDLIPLLRNNTTPYFLKTPAPNSHFSQNLG